MINITEATVRPGESLATFPITVPRPTGITSAQERCLGKPRQISFTGNALREIPYNISVWLTQTRRTYPFVIKTNVPNNNKSGPLATKLRNHFDASEDSFPLQGNLPRMSYIEEDIEDPHWVLELPGRSEFYCSNELFFYGLQFGKHPDLQGLQREMGGRGTARTTKKVNGFFNYSDLPLTVRSDTMHYGDSLDSNLGVQLPDSMQLQIELMDWGRQNLFPYYHERRLQPANKENAVRIASALMDRMTLHFGFKSCPISIVSSSGDTVLFSSQRFADNPGVTLTFEFNPEMSAAYGITEGHRFIFPLDTPRAFELQIKNVKDDPFVGLYPIVMRATGSGQPILYVEGMGHTSIFAYLTDKTDNRHPILTDGMTFETERSFIIIEFFDRNKQLVVFKDGHKIEMLIQFQFL